MFDTTCEQKITDAWAPLDFPVDKGTTKGGVAKSPINNKVFWKKT